MKNKINTWDEKYALRKKQFDKLIDFLKKETNYVKKLNKSNTISLFGHRKTAKEKLYFIFIDCLNASGGNNLTNSGKGSKTFLKVLNSLNNKKEIKFEEFCTALKCNVDSKELFQNISNNKFKNFGYKKAALFLKSIHFLQSTKDNKIFNDLSPNEIHRPIPLDIVISEIVSQIMRLKYTDRIKTNDAKQFNQWAEKKFIKEYYLLEDLWFWGYYTQSMAKNKYRTIEFNEAKLVTNLWFYPESEPNIKPKLEEFARLIKSLKK